MTLERLSSHSPPAIHAMACEDRPQVGGQRNCEQEWTISPVSSVTPIE